MAQVYDDTDLLWTARGDLAISHNGDIMDTYDDPLRSFVQEIRTRLASDLGEWVQFPTVGATLSDYVGRPNNKMTAESIKTRITSSLTRDGLVNSRDLKVMYAPIAIDRILFRLSIDVAPTALNAGSDSLTIQVLYNYAENNIFVLSGRG